MHRREGRIQDFDVVRIHKEIVCASQEIFWRLLVYASWTAFLAQSMEGLTKKMYKITVELAGDLYLVLLSDCQIFLDFT